MKIEEKRKKISLHIVERVPLILIIELVFEIQFILT